MKNILISSLIYLLISGSIIISKPIIFIDNDNNIKAFGGQDVNYDNIPLNSHKSILISDIFKNIILSENENNNIMKPVKYTLLNYILSILNYIQFIK